MFPQIYPCFAFDLKLSGTLVDCLSSNLALPVKFDSQWVLELEFGPTTPRDPGPQAFVVNA